MQSSHTHAEKPTIRKPKADCCADPGCEGGLRNNYFDGKRLTTDAFVVERDFLQGRRQLINRAMHGWGVVYGFRITNGGGAVTIGSGLAFDQCGHELLQAGRQRIEMADLLVLDDKLRRTDPDRAFLAAELASRQSAKYPRACWLLSVHYAERDEGPVLINDPCSCQRQEWDRTCETVRYSLQQIPCAECCEDAPCTLTCTCESGSCCDEKTGQHSRGGCRCLCDHLTGLTFEACDRLCTIEDPCGDLRIDLAHGVPLACIEVGRDGCDDWEIRQVIDDCGPRRLVKRNDLLFDLIRGCDLTRISEIGWAEWHRRETPPVPFDLFAAAWGPDGRGQQESVTERFWVRFSRPVREETLLPDCFAVTMIFAEREGWRRTLRVPVIRVATTRHPNDPPGHVSEARVVVSGRWVDDGLRDLTNLFASGDSRIEIEVRCDFIIDCNAQAVDANPVGLSPFPTGNGTPGGTFLSSFRVAAASDKGAST